MKTFQEAKDTTAEAVRGFVDDDHSPMKSMDRLRITHALEEQTGKLPWVSWVGLSVFSLSAAALLLATDRKHAGFSVGLLAPCFLIMGVYNKIAKIDAILASDTNTVHSNVH